MEADLALFERVAASTAAKHLHLFRAFPWISREDLAQECLLALFRAHEKWDSARGNSLLWIVAYRAVTHLYEKTIRARRHQQGAEPSEGGRDRPPGLVEQAEQCGALFEGAALPTRKRCGRPGHPARAYAAALTWRARLGLSFRQLASAVREREIALALGFVSGAPTQPMKFHHAQNRFRFISVGAVMER